MTEVHLDSVVAVEVNPSVLHAVKVLGALQVPKLVEKIELSLLHESVHDDVQVGLRFLSRDNFVFVETLDILNLVLCLYGVGQLPHSDYYDEDEEQD